MSKGEWIIQLAKIALGVVAILYLLWWGHQVLWYLEQIAIQLLHMNLNILP